MIKKICCFFSAFIVMVITLGLVACTNNDALPNSDVYTYITIDINPSVEIIVLGNDVIEVKAANYDACVLLEGEDFSSMTVEETTSKIVCLAEELGYLTDENNEVKISVISDDSSAVEILKNAAKSGVEKGSSKAVAVQDTRLQDKLTLEKLKEEAPDKFKDLTEEKIRLIESVMEFDSSMTYEIGATMTIKELSSSLKEAMSDNKDIFTQELRREYSALYATKKQEIESEMAMVYGEEYYSNWQKFTALENLYNSIVDRLNNLGLDSEDIAVVMELLDIIDETLIQKGGIVKPEYVLNYIEKHIDKKGSTLSQSLLDSIVQILDKYDTSNYILTEEEMASAKEATEEDVDYLTLSEIANNLTERKNNLEAIKNSIELNSEQIAQLEALKEGFSSIKEIVLAEMQETIAAVREEIIAEKQARSNRN